MSTPMDHEAADRISAAAERDPDSPTATIGAIYLRYGPSWVAAHLLQATVPADWVQIADDLSSISVTGGGSGSYVTGQTTASASGPPQPWIAPAGCERTTGSGSIYREAGTYSGDLTFHFLLGGTRNVADFAACGITVENPWDPI